MEIREVEDIVELLPVSSQVPLLGKQVNYQPLCKSHPKLKSYPLNLLSNSSQNKVQESLVVFDLLNVLLGLEGTYIRYNNTYSPYECGVPEFKIAKMMDSSLKSICNRVVKLGQLYIVLTQAYEKWSDPSYGKVLQRLSYEIREFLHKTYLRFIVEKLETEFKTNPSFSIRDFEQFTNDTDIAKQMGLLYNICQVIDNETSTRKNMDRMQEDFNNFMNDLKEQSQFRNGMILVTDTRIQPIAKGGVILKILEQIIQENIGDRSNIEFLKNLLNNVSIEYCQMLHYWLVQGELHDIYDEFMITDTMKKVDSVTSSLKYGDRIWDTQYVVRKDGLLNKFSTHQYNDLLFKVLMTGKLLNVIKTSYGVLSLPTNDIDNIPAYVELTEGTNLELYIDKWYSRANSLCLNMYLKDYDLTAFLRSLQTQYFGYHNSNNINKFLQKNMIDLTKHYKNSTNQQQVKLQRSFELEKQAMDSDDLISQLINIQLDSQPFESVVSQFISGTQPDVANSFDVEGRTDDNRLLQANNFQNLRDILLQEVQPTSYNEDGLQQSQKSSIHHLQFEVIIPYPLNIIVTRTCMVQYQIVSRYVFLLHYHSKLLDDTWSEINKNSIWRYNGYSPLVRKSVIQKCRILHNKMSQFIKVILEYYTQNVIDEEMDRLLNFTNLGDSMDDKQDIIYWQRRLQECLTNIMTNCSLSQMIQLQMQIFEIIYKFCKFITSMRRRLCQIDPKLHNRYLSGTNQEYNEEEAITAMIPEIVQYTSVVSHSFEQHTAAFMEGLTHYYHRNRSGSGSSSENSSNNHYNTERLIGALGK